MSVVATSEPSDRLTPTAQATTHAIEHDLVTLFARWEARGFPRAVVIPTALFFIVDLAKRSGVSYERVVKTLHVLWHGRDRQCDDAAPRPEATR